jgi:hypothetical protein
LLVWFVVVVCLIPFIIEIMEISEIVKRWVESKELVRGGQGILAVIPTDKVDHTIVRDGRAREDVVVARCELEFVGASQAVQRVTVT